MQKLEKTFSLNQLTYFVCVAKHLSFRKAAQALGVSQPTLTTQIGALEQTLGMTLFERSRTGTHLSPEGRAILSEAEQVLTRANTFLESAKELAEGENTTYSLGVPPTLGPYLLPHIFPDLHRRYPRLRFYVREAAPQQLYQGLLSGEYDLIMTPLSPNFREDGQIVSHDLFTESLKLVVPSEHRLAGRRAIYAKDLAGEKILTLEDRHQLHHQVLEVCARLGADVARDYEGTSLDTLRQMVVMGMGAAFLPSLYIYSELHNPQALFICELSDQPVYRDHVLAWRNTSPSRNFYRDLAIFIRVLAASHLSEALTFVER